MWLTYTTTRRNVTSDGGNRLMLSSTFAGESLTNDCDRWFYVVLMTQIAVC